MHNMHMAQLALALSRWIQIRFKFISSKACPAYGPTLGKEDEMK